MSEISISLVVHIIKENHSSNRLPLLHKKLMNSLYFVIKLIYEINSEIREIDKKTFNLWDCLRRDKRKDDQAVV